MARRRRGKRHGRKGSKAIPLVQTAIIAYPALQAFNEAGGVNKNLPAWLCLRLTGYNPSNKSMDWTVPVSIGGALLVASTIGAKIANRTGANRMVKKLSGGFIKLL